MKRILSLIVFISTVMVCCGQSQAICDYLQQTGRVAIVQDNRLAALVGTQPKTYYSGSVKVENNSSVGYRIRLFSGNQQVKSKNRCYSIQSTVHEKMPGLPTYVTFKSPNWRISVGDYRTSEEASAMVTVLRRTFPEYAKEMFVVKEKINF